MIASFIHFRYSWPSLFILPFIDAYWGTSLWPHMSRCQKAHLFVTKKRWEAPH